MEKVIFACILLLASTVINITKGGIIMDAGTITSMIGSLGFPIACCIALFIQLRKSDENHKEEMQKVTEALNQNTLAITELTDKLRKDGN